MKFWGIFLKVVFFFFIYVVLVFYLDERFGVSFFVFLVFGFLMVFFGFFFWFFCYFQVLRVYLKGKLFMEGCYLRVRYLIYFIWGFFVILGFFFFGGFMFLFFFVYWVGVFGFIGEEEKVFEEMFGDGWREYVERMFRFVLRF